MGKLLAINISKERGTEKREVPQAELVADYGIMGDAHAGKWHRQVSLLSAEKIDAFRARGAQIDNGAFGENLIISDLISEFTAWNTLLHRRCYSGDDADRQAVSFALCYLQEDGRVHYAKGGRVCSSHKRRSDSYRGRGEADSGKHMLR